MAHDPSNPAPCFAGFMSEAEMGRTLRELKDRQEVLACVTNYCRGVDRMDRELLLSCYHPDAIDDHGGVIGDPETFADWVLPFVGKDVCWSHVITTQNCDLQGDVAHGETYFIGITMRHDEPGLVWVGGRYIDRLERRDGRWAIAVRKVVKDWWGKPGDSGLAGLSAALVNSVLAPSRSREDPSYMRPLVHPARA